MIRRRASERNWRCPVSPPTPSTTRPRPCSWIRLSGPSGLVTAQQVDRAIVSNLSVTQSLSVIWPQIVGLLALTAALFAIAYVAFMRQDVRA